MDGVKETLMNYDMNFTDATHKVQKLVQHLPWTRYGTKGRMNSSKYFLDLCEHIDVMTCVFLYIPGRRALQQHASADRGSPPTTDLLSGHGCPEQVQQLQHPVFGRQTCGLGVVKERKHRGNQCHSSAFTQDFWQGTYTPSALYSSFCFIYISAYLPILNLFLFLHMSHVDGVVGKKKYT